MVCSINPLLEDEGISLCWETYAGGRSHRGSQTSASLCRDPIGRRHLMGRLGLRHEDHFRKAHLLPALEAGLIERTVPDKPRNRLQRRRLTAKRKAFIQKK